MRLRRCTAAAGRRLASERGFTLSEVMVVLVILGIVLAALTQLFVSASTAQVDMTRRFEAQQDMRLALDGLRREIHCARTVSGAPGPSIVINLGSYCPTNKTGAPADVTWCTKGTAAPYSLWRYEGAACSGTGRKVGDYLTIPNVFTGFTSPLPGHLPALSVRLRVDLTPADAKQGYTLEDDIVLRNAGR